MEKTVLPRPTCITRVARTDINFSGDWASIVYHHALTDNEQNALRHQLGCIVPVKHVEFDGDERLMVVRVKFKRGNPNRHRRTLAQHLEPECSSVFCLLYTATIESRPMAVLTFVVEDPRRSRDDVIRELTSTLRPLGQQVTFKPYALAPETNALRWEVEGYTPPRPGLLKFLATALLPSKLVPIASEVKEVSSSNYQKLLGPTPDL